MSKELTAREFIPKNDSGIYSRNEVETLAEQYAQAFIEEEKKAFKEYMQFIIICDREGRPLLEYEDWKKNYYETKQ